MWIPKQRHKATVVCSQLLWCLRQPTSKKETFDALDDQDDEDVEDADEFEKDYNFRFEVEEGRLESFKMILPDISEMGVWCCFFFAIHLVIHNSARPCKADSRPCSFSGKFRSGAEWQEETTAKGESRTERSWKNTPHWGIEKMLGGSFSAVPFVQKIHSYESSCMHLRNQDLVP